ncbi:MAG: DUF4097 domain-containing protein [Eubacterium sp.]|nr:DUF4097 domain-containing protein [Eubacterium sp.]
MKKRLIYFIVLGALTIAAIVYGVIRQGHITVSAEGGLSFGFVRKGDTQVSDSTDSFTDIDVQVSQDDIEVEEGKSFGWTYVGPKDMIPSVKADNDTFTVVSSGKNTNNALISGGRLTITIPSGSWKLGKVSLSTNNGDISIDPDQKAEMQSMGLSSANGDISISDCSGKTADICTSNGDITLDDASFDHFDLQSGNGDIALSLSDSLDNYTVIPSASAGDISVGEDTYSSGKKLSIGSGKKTIKAVTSLGDIVIDD